MRRLYRLPLRESTADTQQDRLQQQLAEQGLLSADGIDVEQVGLSTDDLALSGRWDYGEPISEKVARELESLGKSGFGPVPYWSSDQDLKEAGYYEVSSAQVDPAHATTKRVYTFDASISLVGTHESHWRAVELSETDVSGSNPHANGSTEPVGIDPEATKTRWFSTAEGTDPADVSTTVASEFTDIDLYDPPAWATHLIYELPFSREGPADVVVWDPRDSPKKFIASFDDSGLYGEGLYGEGIYYGDTSATQWIHVYNTGYEFTVPGEFLIDNGRFRLWFDEAEGELHAETWDGSDWQAVTIDHSDFGLYDASLQSVGAAQVTVRVEFEAVTDGATEVLEAHCYRGSEWPVWIEPEDQAPISSELADMVEPIASDASTVYEPDHGLLERTTTEGV